MEENTPKNNSINIKVWKSEDQGELQNIGNVMVKLLEYAFQYVPFQESALEMIVIAEPDDLKDAIHWVQDRASVKRGFSSEHSGEDAYHTTAAKTIPRLNANGNVVSTIVFNLGMLRVIAQEMNKLLPSMADWDESAQMFVYTLVHELGHVFDNFVRHDYQGDQVDLFVEEDWKILAKHGSGVVCGEFNACFYAARAVHPILQQQMINWYDETDYYLSDLVRRRDNFVYNANLAAIHNLWVLISQFSKLIGHRANNPDLEKFEIWEDIDDEDKQIFEDLEHILLNDFPAKMQNEDFEDFGGEKLIPIWLRLADSYGFDFQD